jgi:tetratricopeptide (TPR) repeat protein
MIENNKLNESLTCQLALFTSHSDVKLDPQLGSCIAMSSIDPSLVQSLREGIHSYMAGKYNAAIEQLNSLSEQPIVGKQACFWLGLSFHITQQHDKVIKLYEHLLEQHPNWTVLSHYLALSYLSEGNDKSAVHHFEQLIKNGDAGDTTYDNLIGLYIRTGQLAKALKLCHQGLQNHLESKKLAEWMDYLENIDEP